MAHLLSGGAIARDWALPELPSGTPTSTPSLPTSQELAEIFGNSDDEDDDFPFPLSSDLQIGSTLSSKGGGGDSQGSSDTALFSSVISAEGTAGIFQGQVGDPPATPPAADVGGASEEDTDGPAARVRKSSRISARQPLQPVAKKGVTKSTKLTKKTDEKPKLVPNEGYTNVCTDAEKSTNLKMEAVKAATTAQEEEKEGEGEGEGEGEDSEEEEEGSLSDDPDRLWCVCKQPHDDRFMICCDSCEEWFHGDCVGITVSQGRRMERAGKEYICPVCIEKTENDKAERAASRMARQAKREQLREGKLGKHIKSSTEKQKDTSSHRKRSLSSSKDSSGAATDDYGINLLFQPDNAPHRQPGGTPHDGEERGGRGERRTRSFYRDDSQPTTCLAPQCSAQTTPPSLYCSDTCIENYATDALKTLSSRGVTFETNPSEFVRGSKGISMVDKASGKTVIGIQAPTDKTLVPWLKQHRSYEVLLPAGRRDGKPVSSRSVKRTRSQDEGRKEGGEVRREGESPGKQQRSLNDPETVRNNAKKALLQTMWKRIEAVDDVKLTQEQVEEVANQIEEQLYGLQGDINTKYKTKYRSLLFNLKDRKNQGLFRKVCLSEITPSDLVRMKSEQYASDELAEWREKTLKKDLDKIVEREEEARTSKQVIRKITYKGEEEIEAERTEAIETIVAPSDEELGQIPSTPLTPTTTKHAVQSQDGTKTSENGTKAITKRDGNKTAKPAKPDGLKAKHRGSSKQQSVTSPDKSDATSKPEAKDTGSETMKKDAAGGVQPGSSGLLDLLIDTTSEHGKHVYHPQCQICLGTKAPPLSLANDTEPELSSGTDVEDMNTDSLPPAIPLLWEGLVDMPGTVSFTSSAYPVSGSTDYVATVLPSTLHVMGRIARAQVWDYVDKLQASTSREIAVLRFDWTEEDRDGYESMLNYLVRKRRFGVVEENLHGIKDFYLVPLMVDQEVPVHLLPFTGPGLPEDRPNLLLGVIVQTKGLNPTSPSSQLPSLSSSTFSTSIPLKRHLSSGSGDHTTEPTTAAKRQRKQQAVGFGGETPPPVDDDGNEESEPMDTGEAPAINVGNQKREILPMSFYGRHQSVSESQTSPSKPSGTPTTIFPQPTSGIKSILSQLTDENLKELASAMSNLEESASPAASVGNPSTVTSPATGQTVTAPSGETESGLTRSDVPAQPHAASSTAISSGSSGFSRYHQPPNLAQLQRPPLHSAPEPPPQQGYSSPRGNEGAPSNNWDPRPQHYQSQTNEPPNNAYSQSEGPLPQNPAPPPHYQYPGPPSQYPAPPYQNSPQQYSGPPPQQSGPPHQYPGPPNQPHGQQYANPPHEYRGVPQDQSGGPPHHQQHGPPYSYDPQSQQAHYDTNYPDRGRQNWSPPQPYSHHGHSYYENESRLDDMETRDYGHRSQPPSRTWRAGERGHRSGGREGWRHEFREGQNRR